MTRRILPLFAAPLVLLWTGLAGAQPAAGPNVVRAEAPVVAGNAVSAKKLALADAFRQATEQALADLVKQSEPVPPGASSGILQLKASLGTGAQKYVRSYRLIEQQVDGGVVKVMVEVDVDQVLLRRELDRIFGNAIGQGQTAKKPVASALLVAGGAAPLVAAALGPQGARAQLDPATTEAQLLVSAARQNAFALFLTLQSQAGERVRGTTRIPVKCIVGWRLFAPQNLRGPVVARGDEEYGFGDDEAVSRTACVERVAGTVARNVVAALRTPVVSAPFVTLQIELTDVGVVPLVLQSLKRVGAVVATEVRHLAAGRADIRVFSRAGGPALFGALVRELAGKVVLVPTQPVSDVIAVKAQSPEVAPAASDDNR